MCCDGTRKNYANCLMGFWERSFFGCKGPTSWSIFKLRGEWDRGRLGRACEIGLVENIKRRARRECRELCALCGLCDDRFHATWCVPLITTRWNLRQWRSFVPAALTALRVTDRAFALGAIGWAVFLVTRRLTDRFAASIKEPVCSPSEAPPHGRSNRLRQPSIARVGPRRFQARNELVPVVYRELRRRAGAYLRRERSDQHCNRRAVYEAYLRLTAQDRVAWQNRAHFFAIAAQMMRRVLIDHAREHQAAKRPGGHLKVLLDGHRRHATSRMRADDGGRGLVELTRIDPRQGQIVELRYFGDCRSRRSRPSSRFRARR